MFIVEVEIQGKKATKTFNEIDMVIKFYMEMCKSKMENTNFSFRILTIVRYDNGTLTPYRLIFTYSGIYLDMEAVADEE